MLKKGMLLNLVLILALLGAGCQAAATTTAPTSAPVTQPTTAATNAPAQVSGASSIILIMSQPKGDPFGDLVYSGLQRLQTEVGSQLSIKLVESVDKAEYTDQVRSAAENGANPVLVLWDDLANAVVQLAPSYPKTNFIIIDSLVTADLANVKTVVIQPMAASFIAGVVAAETSKTKKVGFVGGADIPVIENYWAGFASGVKYVDPSIKIDEQYAGTFIDPNKGLEIGTTLFNQGDDVVMQAANKTGLGVLQAAKQAGKQGIGVDMWQGDQAPGNVLWSALKPADEATYTAAKEALTGKFTKGMWSYGPAQGASLYDKRDFEKLSPDVQAIVLKVVEDIKSGKLVVPATKKDLANFNAKLQ